MCLPTNCFNNKMKEYEKFFPHNEFLWILYFFVSNREESNSMDYVVVVAWEADL